MSRRCSQSQGNFETNSRGGAALALVDLDLPAAQVGDLVAVYQSGAYGVSASPQGFLGHPACLEVLV